MRLLALEDLKEEMTVAQPIYGINGEILVKEKGQLNQNTLKKLQDMGWNYLYVDDEFSKDIEAKCAISPKVRSEAITNIRKLYLAIAATYDKDIEAMKKRNDLQVSMKKCLTSIDKLLEDIITGSISLVDVYDVKMIQNYKYAHSVNVCIISLVIGQSLGFGYKDLYELGVGAFFHDMGQMFIPDSVLEKQTTYTEEDFEMMKKHPELGYRYARDNFELPTRSFLAILQHHERYDGTGYPLGKKGEEINEFARIVAVADVYDALTSDKPYRKPMMPVAAFKHIISNNKKAFDPKIVKLFFDKVSPYPIGFTLHLPDGRDVIVAENIEGQPLYPKVKVISYKGLMLEQPYITILE